MLVQRMEKAAASRGIDFRIEAVSVAFAERGLDADAACVLIGPQVSYTKDLVEEANPGVPVALIPMLAYGRMDADAVLDLALELVFAHSDVA